ncbi:MAG: hypothetical protein AAB074_02645 [Planctomycetota bacterium]
MARFLLVAVILVACAALLAAALLGRRKPVVSLTQPAPVSLVEKESAPRPLPPDPPAAETSRGTPVSQEQAPADPFSDYLAVRDRTLRRWRDTRVDMRSGTLAEILADLASRFRLEARAQEAIAADPERWQSGACFDFQDGTMEAAALLQVLNDRVPVTLSCRFGKLWARLTPDH